MREVKIMAKVFNLLIHLYVLVMILTIASGTMTPALAQDGSVLTTEEIVALLSDNTIKGKGYSLYYTADGTVHGKEGSYRDTGKWTAAEDLFCVRWSKWAQGKELCWKLRKKGDKIYREGVVNADDNEVTWFEGNVDDL
jgi:hypothetical protein